jgi:hypothetical protein
MKKEIPPEDGRIPLNTDVSAMYLPRQASYKTQSVPVAISAVGRVADVTCCLWNVDSFYSIPGRSEDVKEYFSQAVEIAS